MSGIQALNDALSGRYVIDREIGAGGMATVYLAHDVRHDRRVAVKVLRLELAAALGTERFLQETRITARLDHPHILTLIDSGEAAGSLFYVLPFVRGESLGARLHRETRLSIDDALLIVRQVASALDYAHRQGVVHRDIKPENILMHEGEAVVADFGIALAIASAAGERLTQAGLSLGTPAYMSMEQMTGDASIDGRTDQYALASVLYELLTGDLPYAAPTPQSMIAKRATGAVPSARVRRPEIPAALDAAIRKGMAPAPDQRFETVMQFADACSHAVERPSAGRRTLSPVLLVLVLAAIAIAWPLWGRLQRERSRASLVQVERLAKAGRFADAYALATAAERWIRSDTTLARLLPVVADHLSIVTDPAGASVSIERFSPDAPSSPRRAIGTTPIANLRLARGDYRVVIAKDGFAPVERIASSAFQRFEFRFSADSTIRIRVALPPKNEESDEMVRVDGGRHVLVGPDAPAGTIVTLDDFAIDRYEVTNENYKTFVRAGGYGRASLWQRDFVEQGKPVGAADAMRRFVDKTGLPSPRSWSNQDFPNGMSRHPVSDVSWYEAEAYCEWKGKQLPTLFQWEQAARGPAAAPGEAIVLPWGAAAPSEPANHRANLGTNGTTAVGSYPFGISPYGAYDMAGNVAEWTRTPVERGFVSTGASFEDPVYVFAAYAFHDGFLATPALGFRCSRTAARAARDQGASLLRVYQRTPEYQPVSESAFRALRSHYEYDHRPLLAHVLERSSLPDWTREKIQYVAGNSDSVIAFLYLPRLVSPPYQTIVYVPSNAAFFGHPASDEVERVLAPHIKAGRAVWVAVLKGMIGHEWEPNHPPAPSNSVQFRDEMVLRATEVRRGLDYLESRPDIDHERLAYYGFSWGSGSRLVFAGVDDRFRSIVFVGGGIDERLQPTMPEASNINFAAFLKPPKLLVNGHNDEDEVWVTRGLPLWNLLREPKKLVLVEGAGHLPPAPARVPAINAFLDETLGPVKRP